MTPSEIKKALIASGFEFFRTLPDGVVLAERVRENQILDSGVRVRSVDEGFIVTVVMHAEKRDYPNDKEHELFARVRALAAPIVMRGYVEKAARVNVVKDPSDEARTLDTFYELVLERVVKGDWSDVALHLREAIGFEKAVSDGHGT